MPRSTSQQQQSNGQRAAIYARVSDKSQDTEDKTSISEQISDMEAHCRPGSWRRRPRSGGSPVQAATPSSSISCSIWSGAPSVGS